MHSSSPDSSRRPPLQLLFAVALLSAAVLGFEVALTRLFSVLLRYHFAFLAISVALCGLGMGGYLAQQLRRRGAVSLPLWGLLFSVTLTLSLFGMLDGVFAFFPEAFWLAAVLVLFPFTCGGVFLAEAFARYSQWSGKLYAWDLAGAALAAIGIVGLLQLFGAINASLIVAALGALAAMLAESPEDKNHGKFTRVFTLAPLLFMALAIFNSKGRLLDIPAIPPRPDSAGLSLSQRGITQDLYTELGTPGHTSRIIDTRWNAFARTDVVADTQAPDTLLVYTNGNVPTNMMKWNGDARELPRITADFPLLDWVFANAPLGQKGKPRGDVLSIGPGGGLDALMALRYRAKSFDGAEINPSIVGLMHDYRGYNGDIYSRPNIKVRTADGRDAVREAIHDGKRYALIYSALTKTATAGQGVALLESFIYTQDAFADYWDALEDGGQVAIVTDQIPLMARLFATSLAMLKARGMSEAEACRHVVLAGDAKPGPYRFAIIVSKTAFSPAQTFELSESTSPRSLTPIWLPGRAALTEIGPYPSVAAGQMNTAQFVAWWLDKSNVASALNEPVSDALPLDMSPCPDDRPFVLDLTTKQPLIFVRLAAGATILGLLLAALGWRKSTPEFRVPVSRRADTFPDNEPASVSDGLEQSNASPLARWLYIAYFSCLGVGFMLVEIPLSQTLILPLGYPTLALTVILFSVLLGGGAGSWFSQRLSGSALRRWVLMSAIGVALLAILTARFSGALSEALLNLPLTARCIVVGLGLLPFGFLLGAPFPAGMRLFSDRFAANVPLIWGLNGMASVVGSLGAALGAKVLGFSSVLQSGAVIYLLAAALIWLASPTESNEA